MAALIKLADLKPGRRCIEIVRHFEQGPGGGYAKRTYMCSANCATIGWGHQIRPGEKFAEPMTLADADALLASDLDRFDDEVRRILASHKIIELAQYEYDALVSLAFNLGTGIRDGKKGDFADSSLLEFVGQGRMLQAANQFDLWIYVGKKIEQGLVRRRRCEKHCFQTGLVNFFE